MAAPVERKVQASTAAAATSGLILWITGRYLFKDGVPDVFASWVYVAVPAAVTFAAGFAARHTPRGKGEPAGNMPAGIPPTMPPAPPLPRRAKTLIPPAAAAEQPAAAGPAEPAAPE